MKKNRAPAARLVSLVFAVLFGLAVIGDFSGSDMEVHFIDVGQGDATLIKTGEHAMLIDAGGASKGTTVQLYLKKQGVEKLDYLILTHTDSDHIGGADVIVSKVDIDTIFMNDYAENNKAYSELLSALAYREMDYIVPKVGAENQLGNASFTIIAPNDTYDDSNNNSIALVLKNGENTFLFSGDCESSAEEDILLNGLDIDVDVYKVAHHGSKTSSTRAFLNAMTPTYGVISCKEKNEYGHPHAETINNLRDMGVKVFRTDEQGSVVAYSDGKKITWNCAPSESWQAGEPTQAAIPTPTSEPQLIPAPTQAPAVIEGQYAVNSNNGKIHIVGECPATGTGKNAMKNPVYFGTYEEAEAYSAEIETDSNNRQCMSCW